MALLSVDEARARCGACFDAECTTSICSHAEELGEPLPSPVRKTDDGLLIVDEDALLPPETWLSTDALKDVTR